VARAGLWSGQPAVLRPDELDAFCAVLGCEISDLIDLGRSRLADVRCGHRLDPTSW
jgi:DNA-binding Xre family transcriptional regulator